MSNAAVATMNTTIVDGEIQTNNTNEGVQLSWEPVEGTYEYEIVKRSYGFISYSTVFKSLIPRYMDRTVKNGKAYSYQVICHGEKGKAITTYESDKITFEK